MTTIMFNSISIICCFCAHAIEALQKKALRRLYILRTYFSTYYLTHVRYASGCFAVSLVTLSGYHMVSFGFVIFYILRKFGAGRVQAVLMPTRHALDSVCHLFRNAS